MNRIQTLLAVILIAYVGGSLSEGFQGVSVQCFNSNCTVEASSSIQNIAYSVFIVIFIVSYRKHSVKNNAKVQFGKLHIVIAFFLDFVLIMVIATSYAALPLLLSESSFIGTFNWSFHRDFSRSTDTIYTGIGLIIILIVGYYYFYKHKKIQKLTVGQYILSGIK